MRSKKHLSNIFSTITFQKNIFLNRSEEGWRPTKRSICGCCKVKVSVAPLYFLDTLVNPETYLEFFIWNSKLKVLLTLCSMEWLSLDGSCVKSALTYIWMVTLWNGFTSLVTLRLTWLEKELVSATLRPLEEHLISTLASWKPQEKWMNSCF